MDDEPRDLLKPFPAERMTMWPINRKVGSPKNDTPDILDREVPSGLICSNERPRHTERRSDQISWLEWPRAPIPQRCFSFASVAMGPARANSIYSGSYPAASK